MTFRAPVAGKEPSASTGFLVEANGGILPDDSWFSDPGLAQTGPASTPVKAHPSLRQPSPGTSECSSDAPAAAERRAQPQPDYFSAPHNEQPAGMQRAASRNGGGGMQRQPSSSRLKELRAKGGGLRRQGSDAKLTSPRQGAAEKLPSPRAGAGGGEEPAGTAASPIKAEKLSRKASNGDLRARRGSALSPRLSARRQQDAASPPAAAAASPDRCCMHLPLRILQSRSMPHTAGRMHAW